MRESVLATFAEKGVLPPKEVAHWRAPMGEDFPQPWAGEVVSFLSFHEHGLGYPAHLNEWGLELQHLNLTRVLHIAGFITVYETFLRMEPHVDFVRRIFTGRALSEGNHPGPR